MKKIILFLVAILINCAAFAQVPQIVSWQGIIQDAQGNNLNGQHTVTCKLFDVATGGNALWTETHNNLQITDGLANISLGSVTALNLPFDKQYWLEITVGNGTPLPRIQLLSVPYSLYSTKSNGVIQNDSLVLKDSRGVTRMVLNPNTGTFKMMNNDTTWYEVSVQSPPTLISRDGTKILKTEKTEDDGTKVEINHYIDFNVIDTKKTKITSEENDQYRQISTFSRTKDGKEINASSESSLYKKVNDQDVFIESSTSSVYKGEYTIQESYSLKKTDHYEESRKETTIDGKNISNYTKIQYKDDENNDAEKTVTQLFDGDGKISSTKEKTITFDQSGTTQTNEKSITDFDPSGNPINWIETTSTKGQNTNSEKTTTFSDGKKSSETLNVKETVKIPGTDNVKRIENQKSYLYDESGNVKNTNEKSNEMVVGQTVISQKSEEKNISYSSDGKPSNGSIKSTNFDEAGNGLSTEHTITAFNSDGTPKTFQLKKEQHQGDNITNSIETHQDNQIQAKETKSIGKLSNGDTRHEDVKEDYKNGIKVSAHYKSYTTNKDGTETIEHEEIVYYNNNGEPISSKVLKSKLGGSILETEKELYLNKSKKTTTETFSSSGYTINDKILKSDGSTDLNIIQNYIPGNGGKVNRIVVDPVNSNISTKIEQSPTQIEITGKVKFKDDVEFANPPQNNTFTNIYIQNGDAKTSITTNDHSLNYNRNTQFSFAGMAQGYSAKIFPIGSTGEGFRFALQTPSTLLNGIRVQKDPSAEGKSILGVDADKFQVGYGTTTEFMGVLQ